MTIQTETANLLILKEMEPTQRVAGIFLISLGTVMIFLLWGDIQKVGLSILSIIVGIGFTIMAKTVTITIDKTRGKIRFTSIGFAEKTNHEIDLTLIKKIELGEEINKYHTYFLQYCLIFKIDDNNGIDIPINSPAQDFSIRGSTSLLWGKRNSVTALAKKVADFIGVELVDHKLPF